jgi:hypothetical protein
MNSKLSNILVCFLSATLLVFVFSGCGKKNEMPPTTPMDISGVKVDFPKLQQEFANAPQDVLDSVHQAQSGLRYGQFEKCLQSLDKLASTPNLTESQKKVVNDVIEQMKQVIAKMGPSR